MKATSWSAIHFSDKEYDEVESSQELQMLTGVASFVRNRMLLKIVTKQCHFGLGRSFV